MKKYHHGNHQEEDSKKKVKVGKNYDKLLSTRKRAGLEKESYK